jgi:hypothetical protein
MQYNSPSITMACLAIGLALSGCFASGPSTGEWVKQGVEGNITARDLSMCQREARLVTREESKIDQDIIASRGSDWQTTGSYSSNVSQMRDKSAAREQEMVGRCMRNRGYAQGVAKKPAG